jgi:hypothetical protein
MKASPRHPRESGGPRQGQLDSRFRGNDERGVILQGARALHPFYLSTQPGEGRSGQPSGRLAMVTLQRICGHERGRTKGALRFDRRPRQSALRSVRTNLVAAQRGGKDADHKSGPSPEGYGPQGGGPRYPLLTCDFFIWCLLPISTQHPVGVVKITPPSFFPLTTSPDVLE